MADTIKKLDKKGFKNIHAVDNSAEMLNRCPTNKATYYCSSTFPTNDIKFNDIKTRQYVEVCAKMQGGNFSPWKLNTQEYYDSFMSWYKINSTKDAYMANVKDCIKTGIKFCKQKKIIIRV